MNLFAHAFAKNPVNNLVALHATFSGKGRADDYRVKMGAIALHRQVGAIEFFTDIAFYCFRSDHKQSYWRSLYPDFISHRVIPESTANEPAVTERLNQGDTSPAPKKP